MLSPDEARLSMNITTCSRPRIAWIESSAVGSVHCRGLTLIELLIVIAMIAIQAAMRLPALSMARAARADRF